MSLHQVNSGARGAPLRMTLIASLLVCLGSVLFLGYFGSADVEESANTAFSAGAKYAGGGSQQAGQGIYTVLEVPVYDTLQGTGDRLPYQGSWGQSATWPLRLFVGWEHHFLVRAFFFSLPAIFLCLRTLASWIPRASLFRLTVFGFLINSSFALHLRQNEWSDHYVQTIGACAVSMFFFHRDFHIAEARRRFDSPLTLVLCLALAVNGVLTGHPGFWPLALFVWMATGVVLLTHRVSRGQVVYWMRQMRLPLSLLVLASSVTVVTVVVDLLAEMQVEFGSARLARTQGLFSEYAFGGLYGLSEGGSIPGSLKSVVAALLATHAMPFFVLFNDVLPSMLRASDFRELVRVEFSGTLVIIGLVFGWSKLRDQLTRGVMVQIVVVQAIIWVCVVASTLDLLPTAIAASGAWMAAPIMLVFNVFLSFLLLANISNRWSFAYVLGVSNIAMAAAWMLFLFNVMSFGGGLQIPDRHISRLRVADAVSESLFLQQRAEPVGRVILVNANFYNFLSFVVSGVPVVSPANQKIRDSRQLESNYALNFGVQTPDIFSQADLDRLERVFDFLNVEVVAVANDSAGETSALFPGSNSVQLNLRESDLEDLQHKPMTSFQAIERRSFSMFTVPVQRIDDLEICPVLHASCSVIDQSQQIEPVVTPRLQVCEHDCLWRYSSAAVSASSAVIVPVTYDSALVVSDSQGRQLATSDAAGFLAVHGETGIPETTLFIDLDPDGRIISRVVASYLNLVVIIVLAGMVLFRSQSRNPRR